MSLDEQDVLDRIRCDYRLGDASLTKLIYGVLGSDACKVEDLEELCEAVPSKNVSGGDIDGDVDLDEASLALVLLDVLDRNIDQTGLVSLACRALQRSTRQACLERFNIRVGKTAFKLLEHHATNFVVTKYVFDLMPSSSCDEAFGLVCNTLAHNMAVLETHLDDLSVPRPCVDSTRAALDLVNKKFINRDDNSELVELLVKLAKCAACPLGLLASCFEVLSNKGVKEHQRGVIADVVVDSIYLYSDNYNFVQQACRLLSTIKTDNRIGAMLIFQHAGKAPLSLLKETLKLMCATPPSVLCVKAVTQVLQRCVGMNQARQEQQALKDKQEEQEEEQEEDQEEDQEDQEEDQEEQHKDEETCMEVAMQLFGTLVSDKTMQKVWHVGMDLLVETVRSARNQKSQIVNQASFIVAPYVVGRVAKTLRTSDEDLVEALQDLLVVSRHARLCSYDLSKVTEVLKRESLAKPGCASRVAKLAMMVLEELSKDKTNLPDLPDLACIQDVVETTKSIAKRSCDAAFLNGACKVVSTFEASIAKRAHLSSIQSSDD